MFPVPPIVVVLALVLLAIAGMAVGALSGWLTSLITKCGQKGVLRDSFLGSLGFLVGFIGSVYMPWPHNTVVEQLKGGGTVATTISRYQHPYRVAVVMAVLLPLLHELSRRKKAQTELKMETPGSSR